MLSAVHTVRAEHDAGEIVVAPKPDVVVEVAFGVLHDPAGRSADEVALFRIKMDAMPKDGQGQIKHARVREAAHDALAVGVGAVFLILDAFGDVDVHARLVLAGEIHGAPKQVVVHRKGGVQPDMALAPGGQEGVGFGEPLFLDLLSITAGDFVAEQVSEAHAIQRLGDGFKAAVQMEGRGMVINDEGYAVLGTVQAGNKGAGLDHVVIELFVHAPPDVFQHLKEVRRGLGRGRHAAREGRVDMVMPAAEGGHDETARAVQYGVFRRTLRRRVGVERHPAERAFFDLDRRGPRLERFRVDPCGVAQIQAHCRLLWE